MELWKSIRQRVLRDGVSIRQVQEIESLGAKHGIGLGGFRCFERAVTDEGIERVKRAAHLRPLGSYSATVIPSSRG